MNRDSAAGERIRERNKTTPEAKPESSKTPRRARPRAPRERTTVYTEQGGEPERRIENAAGEVQGASTRAREEDQRSGTDLSRDRGNGLSRGRGGAQAREAACLGWSCCAAWPRRAHWCPFPSQGHPTSPEHTDFHSDTSYPKTGSAFQRCSWKPGLGHGFMSPAWYHRVP